MLADLLFNMPQCRSGILAQMEQPLKHVGNTRKETDNVTPFRQKSDQQADNAPGWADGLRKLYDSVVEEPLPDSFDDLLKKLDQPKNG